MVLGVASVTLSRANWRGEPAEDDALGAEDVLPGAAAARTPGGPELEAPETAPP
jgi:hypothetical protein